MAIYNKRKVVLNKPSYIQKGEAGYQRKKFKVYVKDGNKIKKVMFGDPNLNIKKKNPVARSSFRARHRCDSDPPKDKTKARYWACKVW
tara:strand:- start:1974 stop:2237 length:264 start_codon:yes stop_codon:yes gene_type:complete